MMRHIASNLYRSISLLIGCEYCNSASLSSLNYSISCVPSSFKRLPDAVSRPLFLLLPDVCHISDDPSVN